MKERNTTLNSTIEKLSATSSSSQYAGMVPQKISFFDKIRTNGGLLAPSHDSAKELLPTVPISRSIPIITKNVSSEKPKEPHHFK